MKESLVKTIGTGIGFDVSRLNFKLKTPELRADIVTTDTLVEIDDESAPEWKFEETMIEDHCVVVAFQDTRQVCFIYLTVIIILFFIINVTTSIFMISYLIPWCMLHPDLIGTSIMLMKTNAAGHSTGHTNPLSAMFYEH